MKIIEVQEISCLEIEIERGSTKHYFRRYSDEIWDELYGQSWESVSYPKELEECYQEWLWHG